MAGNEFLQSSTKFISDLHYFTAIDFSMSWMFLKEKKKQASVFWFLSTLEKIYIWK